MSLRESRSILAVLAPPAVLAAGFSLRGTSLHPVRPDLVCDPVRQPGAAGRAVSNKPPVKPADGAAALPADAALGAEAEGPAARAAAGAAESAADAAADDAVAAKRSEPAPRTRRTLGSLDPDGPAQMLVTLSSRGAAVERIELAGRSVPRSGRLVGLPRPPRRRGGRWRLPRRRRRCRHARRPPGLAAGRRDRAGRRYRHAGCRPPCTTALAATKPGQQVTVEVDPRRQPADRRGDARPAAAGGGAAGVSHGAGRRSRRHAARPALLPALARVARRPKRRREPLAELPGLELADRDWKVDAGRRCHAGAVHRASSRAASTVAKEYRLVAGRTQAMIAAATGSSSRWNSARPVEDVDVAYALDGPTGLPTEGWWYAQRVGPRLGLAGRPRRGAAVRRASRARSSAA